MVPVKAYLYCLTYHAYIGCIHMLSMKANLFLYTHYVRFID